MRRLSTELPFHCTSCEVEIRGPALFHVGLPFCCAGCVVDGPCTCSYDEVVIEHAEPGTRSAASADPDPVLHEAELAVAEAELAVAGR
jgi:hypothetical protein